MRAAGEEVNAYGRIRLEVSVRNKFGNIPNWEVVREKKKSKVRLEQKATFLKVCARKRPSARKSTKR